MKTNLRATTRSVADRSPPIAGAGSGRGRSVALRSVSVATLLGAGLMSACTSPAIDRAGYRGKIVHSAEEMTGVVGSARLAAQLDLDGKMIDSVTDTVISDEEDDAQSIVSSFDTVQPPDATSVQLRNSADAVLQNAASNISDLRIATRRHETRVQQHIVSELAKSLHQLQQLQDNS